MTQPLSKNQAPAEPQSVQNPPQSIGNYEACAKQALPEPLRGLVDADHELALSPLDVVALEEREHDRLLIQLVFAARELAERNLFHPEEITAPCVPNPSDGWCRECQMTENDGALVHGSTCATGRVLKIIAQFLALGAAGSVSPNSHGKEAATDGETGCAGDGIRPREVQLTEAARALSQAAMNEIAQINEWTVQCNNCGSSVTGTDKSEADIVHASNCWVGNAFVVLSSDGLGEEVDEGAPYPADRCQICGWPLATSVKDGCVPGNCSFRPRDGSEDDRRIQRRRAALARRDAASGVDQGIAKKLVDEILANKAQVSEIDCLARQLADDGAAANLEGCSYSREIGGYEWMALADEDLVDCERELRYLDLRGVLVRNPDDKHLVRIDWSKGGAR